MPASESQKLKKIYEFGPFRVDPEKEVLQRDGNPIALQPKTFQILLVLVRRSTEVVTKDELMKAVWPDTFVEEANLSRNIFMLRKALGESPKDHQYILTIPGRGYRLAETVRLVPEQEVSIVAAQHSTVQIEVKETKPWRWIVGAMAVAFTVATWWVVRRPMVLTEKDTVVLADFANSTGDPVFDDALKQALRVQLEQSPFLSAVSDQEVGQELALMGRPAGQPMTAEVARELCQRIASKAVLAGSISSLGSHFVIGLNAFNCYTGKELGSEQEEADSRERVLKALGNAATSMRAKLGESLASVQKHDAPIEQATTSSLEALQAFSLGRKASIDSEWTAAIPFFERAVELDPSFAMAYARLGTCYANLGEATLGAKYNAKAYELREKGLSEPERWYIESHYHQLVTGNQENARKVYELWKQTYPRDFRPLPPLFVAYRMQGQYDRALEAAREALSLQPASGMNRGNIVAAYINLDRIEEARSAAAEALAKHYDSFSLHVNLYPLAFLQSDAEEMKRQLDWAVGKPGVEDIFLAAHGNTSAYAGRLEEARVLSRQAASSAERARKKEVAAIYGADAAFREALFGNFVQARQGAAAAVTDSTGPRVEYEAAMAFAISGDTARGERIANDLANRFPEHTAVQFNYLPAIRAQIALSRNDPSKALDVLQSTATYDMGSDARLDPIYVRGEAYLAARQGREAAAEFQKILDHRGIVLHLPIGALAHLQLGRAYATQGDTVKARAAYDDFLTLWKDADPDIPLLKQAKAEYAKLQ